MRLRKLTTIGILLALGGTGCASGHHHHHSDDENSASGSPDAPVEQKIIIVNGDENSGPPPLRFDAQPPQPTGSTNWIAGHWLHDPQLNAWVWVPGRWR